MNEPRYVVVRNGEDQYSIWPEHRPLPDGWSDAGFSGTEDACLSHVDTVWTELRPRSVRESSG